MSHACSLGRILATTVLALASWLSAPAISQFIGFALLKIDPDPVTAGARFSVVFQITNPILD